MQFKKILLPVDGSIHSDHATDYAAHIAKLSGSHVTVVCCYEWNTNLYEVTQSSIDEMKDQLQVHASIILEKTAAKLQADGVDYTSKALSGAPGTVLTGLAKTKEFDLIIMGSHGHSEIAGLFLGSVTHKVLNTIYCPVLIVP